MKVRAAGGGDREGVEGGGVDRAGLDALKGNAIAGITINDGARMLNRSE